MAGEVLDYANWRPPGGAKQLKAAGVAGVVRYIMPARFQWPKALTPLELMDLTFNGLGVAFNFERNERDYRGGFDGGYANGLLAQEAMVELGQDDPGIPVYVSIDTGVYGSDLEIARRYIDGFFTTCKHARAVYGEPAVIARGNTSLGWATNATAWPGDPAAKIVLQQHYNQFLPGLPGAYDLNTVKAADWGQIPRPTAPPVPAPPTEVKVKPQFDPPQKLTFVSRLEIPGKGAWGLQPDWGVITLAGRFAGTMFGSTAVKGRKPSRIVPAGAAVPGANPPLPSYPSWALYECIAESGERYLPPQPK